MELIRLYLCNRISIETNNISNRTFHFLKRKGWYTDSRSNQKFYMLNKRIQVEGQWYRALIRFEYKGVNADESMVYTLSSPCPFIVTECEAIETLDGTDSWKDVKTYHGPTLKNVTGLLNAGVPMEVIDQVYEDLYTCVDYHH